VLLLYGRKIFLEIKGIKPQGKPWTSIKRNDPAASGRGIRKHNKLGFKRLGVAFCGGLRNEARIL